MATVFRFLGVFFLLLLSFVQSNFLQHPFGFIQHLEGSHRGQSVKGLKELKLYLAKYGYLDNDKVTDKESLKNHAKDDEFDNLLESAIKKYQHMYGLNITEGLDVDTLKQMTKPRCGVLDFVHGRSHSHHHDHDHDHHKIMSIHFVGHYQFFTGNPTWPIEQAILTYQIRNSAKVNLNLDVSGICARAFKKWSDVLQIFTFQEVPEGSNSVIQIDFHGMQGLIPNDHGFDGPRGVLGHATEPGSAAFLHFDAEEVWGSVPLSTEVDMESVALHEMGHVLGLNHSSVREAVMFATFAYGITKRDLTQDDIDGILDLYDIVK